ncbi:uncharacterized protein LOC108155281 isoform X2 [Drosophila miranda]|uniref:uncharacterized protein LOC108155281 isoform X2 n=1 Tax=Drosophila miranda TaxID=7229 RepID=UPI0007E812F4|nr:uncharacterized protein LOC108155281 isoform X2 [Drosophila miranda]
MAPALTAEPLSTKEKLTSAASPSVVVKKPATATPATATTRVTRSSKEAAATAAATAAKAAAVVIPQRVPSSRISNKRKLSAGNNSSNKQQNNDPMGLSTAPTPHTTTTTTTGSGVAEAEAEAEAATGGGVPPIVDAAGASTSATGLLESQSPALPQSDSQSTDVPSVTPTIESNNNNNNNSGRSPRKDNSTAQLLAGLTSNFEETISAEICLRKTLPEVSLSKEPAAPSAVAETVVVAEVEAEVVVVGESTTGEPQIDLLEPMELEQPANTTTSAPLEELPKIETDDIEERLSQLDGNASAILPAVKEQEPVQEQEQVDVNMVDVVDVVEMVVPTTPTTPSRQQVQQDPRSESLPATLASPLPGQRQSTAASALNASQLTPQSTSSSTNFLKDAAGGEVLEDTDIEEVLKALKTFEGNHVINSDINPDMCDFNFFNEVWEEQPSATASAPHPSETPPYPNPIGGTIGSSSTPHVLPAESMAEGQKSIEQQQQILTRKIDHLFRRMRKFQARYMCSHTSEEVAGIMEWAARTSHKTPNPVRSDTLSEQETTVLSIVSGRPKPDFWEDQKKHPVPATQMGSLLRSIETAARHQQICHTPSVSSATLAPSSTWYKSAGSTAAVPAKVRRGKNLLDTSAAATSTAASSAAAIEQKVPGLHEIIPCFDTHITNELTHVSGLLHNEMREIQNALDSDATESSSGGESADEMVIYNNTHQKPLTIARRAVWTYSKDRASIALRWSWLCSQMAELEGRKRQYRDLYMDLNHSKGAVELEQLQVQQPANGYKEEPSSEYQCCRARPLMLSKFRKRSLFQTTGIHAISKKAARPSNIKCGCQWPQIPCALCTGRSDPTAPRESAEMMMPPNRVALLDPGYHPVLSFVTDVTQSVHFEAICRQSDWQQRMSRTLAKTVVKGVYKAEREAIAASNSAARRPGDLIKRRYIRRKERNNNNNNSNSTKDAAAAGTAATGLGDSGNGTATSTSSTPSTTPLVANTASRKKQQHQQQAHQPPTGVNGSRLPWPDSRQRQRQRLHSPSSASQISNSDAKRRRISKNNRNSSNSNSNTLNNSHMNGYSDQSGGGAGGDVRSGNRSRHASPTQNQRSERTTERRHRPVYDIDNIVIPYSIAAQTKVEILPYKEIPTPKWRVVDSETDKNTPVQPAASSSDDSAATAPLAATPTTPAPPPPPQIKAGGNGIVPAAAAALNEQKPQPQPQPQPVLVPVQPLKVNGLKKLQQKTKQKINNNNNNGLVNGNGKKEKDALLQAEASEKKDIPPKELESAKEAVVQGLAVQAEANDKNDILSAVGLENDAQSSSAADKKDIQSSDAEKKVIPSPASDQMDIQSKASDQKDIQSTASDQKDIQSTASDTKDILPSAASRKKASRAKKKGLKRKKHRPNGKIEKATATTTKEAAVAVAATPSASASVDAAASAAIKGEAKSKPHLIEGVRIAVVEPMAKRPKLQLAKAGEGDKPKTNAGQAIAPIVQLDPEEDEEDEDTSDEAYIVRHQLALIEERQRFETYLKFPWSTRPRANRRIDSRAESSGANTPDSASPAPHLAGGAGAGDNESIPSPLAHPLEGFNENGEMLGATSQPQLRRRTTSSKLKDQAERRSATPDIKDTFVEPSPFEPLIFPLSEEVYQKMLAERYAPPKYEVLKPEVKRTKSKSTSSNGDGGSTGAGKSKRRSSSKLKSKLVNVQQNGHPTADAAGKAASASRAGKAKINGGGGIEEEVEEEMDDGVDYDPEPEDMLWEELEEDYPKHHLAPLDDDEMLHGSDDLHNSAIDSYLDDPEALEEDMADDPFGDDDPNDPEWKTRSDGSRKRL